MRVIQGKYKGRILEGFTLEGTRPTMERVKESLFAILQPFIEKSTCLDLFAGSGNLGIEALSMSAETVIFVDQNPKAVKVIRQNLAALQEKQEVYCLDYQQALDLFAQENRKFDLIFLDPPYATDYIQQALEKILQKDLLTPTGMIICESDSLDKMSWNIEEYQLVKEKKYGDKYIRIFKRML